MLINESEAAGFDDCKLLHPDRTAREWSQCGNERVPRLSIVRNSAYFNKPRTAAKSDTTDLNQAEDIPPLGSAPLPDPQSQNQISGGKRKEEP